MKLDTIFVICAAMGGTFFVVQLVLQFLGVVGHSDIDPDLDPHAGHPSADFSFKVLSLQGMSAFLMMFGLMGLATLKSGGAAPIAFGVGFAGGGLTTFVIGRLFKFASRLQSSGTLDLSRAVGVAGTVYLTIRKGRPGKVTITVTNRLLTLDACVREDITLETGTPIVVTRVLEDQSVEVRKN
ncbi:MAG TPA: hypothetical protein VGK73_10400 [Polyangiaceae bacterium]